MLLGGEIMFTESKVFIQYIENTLKENKDRVVVAEILAINKLISRRELEQLQNKYKVENPPILLKEQFRFSQDVCQKLVYLCTLMNEAKDVKHPNFFDFFDARFSEDQIMEICKVCISGVYRPYLYYESVPAEKMKMLRQLAESDVEADMLADTAYSIQQAEEIYKAAEAHLPLYFVKPQRDSETLKAFREALQKGLDCTKVSEHDFSYQQLEVIFSGMHEGVDVLEYCDESYSAEQINELILGLLQDVDITVYNDLKYDWEQMRQIRAGLKEGIDVSMYTTENLNAYYMEVLRLSMQNGEGIQYYDNTYDEETHQSRVSGKNFSIDDALESKRLKHMSIF